MSRHTTELSSSGAASVVLRLRLIGQMEAWTLNSENILPSGRKTKALLAVIALSAPRPVMRGRLAELLWSRRPEEQSRASLRQEIHRLLDALGPTASDVLIISREHLALRPGSVWVDVEEIQRATTTNPASLSLLDGELLEDLDGADPAFDAWLAGERERLRDRARLVAETLLREQVVPEAAIPAAQQLLSIDRAHEGAWRALMRAYAERGERGMAIQAYERCRAVLADLLDATPSPETQRLLAEIRASKIAPQPGTATAEPTLNIDGRPDRVPAPRGGAKVGVLPLMLSGISDDDSHLSAGLAEEITAALARFRWMFLVSSASLARFVQQTRDETAIRRTFGIDFLLDGTIQKTGPRLRVTLRLLDLRAGNQVVWARRFDRQMEDLLRLQDEVAAEVVAQIDPEILLIESRRASHHAPHDATAYDLVLRALPLISRLSRADLVEAGDLLRQAIAKESDYAAAHAWFALWHIFYVGQGWSEDPDADMAAAGRLAERAIALDPQDAKALTIAGHVRAFLGRRQREAISLHERALTLNPNLGMAWALSGIAYCYLGDIQQAERRMERYKKLSPMDPHAFLFDMGLLFLNLLKHDYEAVVSLARDISEMNPSFSAACKPYLAALGHLGRGEESALVLRRLLTIEPGFTLERFIATSPFENSDDLAHYVEGLRLAGVPGAAELPASLPRPLPSEG